MTTHEILVAARNLIGREGWIKGPDGMRPDGPVCAMGAVGRVCDVTVRSWGSLSYHFVQQTDAFTALREVEPAFDWAWNDAFGRTKAEVLAAFDKAIAQTAPEPHVELGVPEEVYA